MICFQSSSPKNIRKRLQRDPRRPTFFINMSPPYGYVDREMPYLPKIAKADGFWEFEAGEPEGREAEMVASARELEVAGAVEEAGCFSVDSAACV